MRDTARGEKWIGHARLLAEVPSTSIEYCELYKIPRRVGFPQVHCFYLPTVDNFYCMCKKNKTKLQTKTLYMWHPTKTGMWHSTTTCGGS